MGTESTGFVKQPYLKKKIIRKINSMRLQIEKINVDQFFQMRGKELEDNVVEKYKERIEELPPIQVYLYHGTYYVVDGFHRLEAHKRLGYLYIEAEVTEQSDDETFNTLKWKTDLQANNRFAKSMTPSEKRNVLKSMILNPDYFDDFPNTDEGRRSFTKLIEESKPISRPTVTKVWRELSSTRERMIQDGSKKVILSETTDEELMQMVLNRIGIDKLWEFAGNPLEEKLVKITKSSSLEQALESVRKTYEGFYIPYEDWIAKAGSKFTTKKRQEVKIKNRVYKVWEEVKGSMTEEEFQYYLLSLEVDSLQSFHSAVRLRPNASDYL